MDMEAAVIYDTFLFFNEFELLEIRLEELKDVVDRFVLVEATLTLSGKPKPLFFQDNKERFAGYSIEPVVLEEFPAEAVSSWDREYYLRRAIRRKLEDLRLLSQDLVLLSDVDEIPRAEAVAKYSRCLLREVPGTVYGFTQDLYYYYVNCRSPEPWVGTRMARWADVSDMQALRVHPSVQIRNGGWHFSYLGGRQRVQEKIAAFAHTEFDRPEFLAEGHIDRCLANGSDLFNRGQQFKLVKLDETFPSFLVENMGRFSNLINEYRDEALARQLYEGSCLTPSDIFEHVPYLYRLGSLCRHITELGTRAGRSTSAFIYARPERLIAYDLERGENIPTLERAAAEHGVNFSFRQEDVLKVDLEETDMLFIDTWHVETQMRQELARHADKARLYLVLHDTVSFGHGGETAGHRGIWPAVSDYMRDHPEWAILQHFPNNNGLTVFTRVG
jgi:beta-1,4-mannosyl-glycoprotein beta-1,4-N-acetylglucosaminyltransferase